MKNKYSPEYQTRKTWTLWIFVALLSALLLNSLAGEYFKNAFINLMTALTPLMIGLVIAFILKKLVDLLEQKVFYKWFKKLKHGDKVNRIFCICLLFTLIFLIVYLCIAFLIPEIVKFVEDINNNLTTFVDNIKTQLTEFFNSTGWFNDVDVEVMITDFINKIGEALTENIPLLAESIANLVQQTAIMVGYFVVGVIIAFLILYKKEKIGQFSKRLTYATLSKKRADTVVKTAILSDKILYQYIASKCIEAGIVFLIMLPGFYIFKVPYPIVMAVLIALLNIIPYVGGIIASVAIFAFTIAYSTVSNAIWTMVYIFVIINLYGNFVGPFIYGKKLKVSALLMIISLLVFGGIFGFWGMIIGPPLMAVLSILVNEFIKNKEKEKQDLEAHGLTEEDITDLEILEEASKIVKQRREAENIQQPKKEVQKQKTDD